MSVDVQHEGDGWLTNLLLGFVIVLINVSKFYEGYLTVGRTRLKLSLVVLFVDLCLCDQK